ncbi:RNA 2'-phosphotransferase [Shewanella sp.]|uniref:RNA 2'-phosphotransferase n=1 Tax=Shewanella sp. TaxID=50422 RepID=UPI003A96EA76
MPNHQEVSKLLSFVLRHQPQQLGIDLDAGGWADIQQLLRQVNATGTPLDHQQLLAVVASSDKQRFAISADGQKIRANQGHSFTVDLQLSPTVPPDILLHGTASRFLASIQTQGLQKMARQHVHLTEHHQAALAVGQRYGKPVLLRIDAAAMVAAGHTFYHTANDVWLTESVPPQFIQVPLDSPAIAEEIPV